MRTSFASRLKALLIEFARAHADLETRRAAHETKLKRAAHRQTLSLLGSIAAALGLIAWAGWEFGFARTTNYQVSKIRSEAHACLDGACQSTGWINVLSRLGERDEAIEGARNVPIEERIPALASLSQTGRTFREAFTRMF